MRPVLHEKTGAIGSPQDFLGQVTRHARPDRAVDDAFLGGVWSPVRSCVVHELVHVLPQQIVRFFIPEKEQAGGITERAEAIQIESIDRLLGRVQKKQILLFALLERFGEASGFT